MRKPGFLLVVCSCGNEQRIYKWASSTVRCTACGKTLARPRGGKARIFGRIVKAVR